MKICTKCKQEKPLCDFPNRLKSKDGKDYTCKECHANNQRSYISNNRESIYLRRKEYKSRWYSENKERLSEIWKSRYATEKDSILAYQKEYRKLNPGKTRHWKTKYKLSKKRATPP